MLQNFFSMFCRHARIIISILPTRNGPFFFVNRHGNLHFVVHDRVLARHLSILCISFQAIITGTCLYCIYGQSGHGFVILHPDFATNYFSICTFVIFVIFCHQSHLIHYSFTVVTAMADCCGGFKSFQLVDHFSD